MYEILIVALVIILMAKARKRRYQKYLKGTIDDQLSIGTLSTKDVAKADFAGVVNERTWCSSVKASWALTDWTVTAVDGPLVVGVAHSDYTDAEIEEWIENSGGWDEGNLQSQEIAKRKIRRVGVFATSGVTATDTDVLNEGRPITTKCGWMLLQGQTVAMWAYNMGESAPAAGAIVRVQGHANLWPR